MTNFAIPRVREDRLTRRAQLIDEAIRLIGKHGYHGFTIQALAGQCGLTNAGVIHHIGSKDQLLLAILDEIGRREGERIAPMIASVALGVQGGAEGRASSMAVLREMMVWVLANPEQARFLAALQAESMDPGHPAHRWFGEREIETAELFSRLVSREGPVPANTARQLIALMYGLVMQWLRSGQTFDLLAEWEQAIAIALQASGAAIAPLNGTIEPGDCAASPQKNG